MASSRVSISATPWVSGKHQHRQPAKTQKKPNNNGGNQGTEFLPTEKKSIFQIYCNPDAFSTQNRGNIEIFKQDFVLKFTFNNKGHENWGDSWR